MLLAENPLNAAPLIFPALECFHIAGFTMMVGTIAVVDLRLLGVLMTGRDAAGLVKDMSPWTLLGIGLVMMTGPMMFATDPDMYYTNIAFLIKMALLVAGLLFHYLVHNRVLRPWTALVSLAIWFGVIAGAIFIGFVV